MVEIGLNLMRRRPASISFLEANMDKEQGKSRHSRICLLASLAAFFWLALFYFHFAILDGKGVIDNSTQQLSSSLSVNTDFSSNKNTPPARNDPSPPLLNTSPPEVDLHPQSITSVSTSAEPKPVVTPAISSSSSNAKKPQSDTHRKTIDSSNKVESVTRQKTDDSSNKVESVTRQKTDDSSNKVESVTRQKTDDSRNKVESVTRQKTDSSNKVENYPFMRALRTVDNKSDPCGGRYIYVHDLPPRFNEDMLKECETISVWTNMCKFISNAGLGPPLENDEGVFSNIGWYATNQFALELMFHNRMKQYDCLTRDSSLAAAIFVPFYAGFEISRHLWGYNISMRDAASLDLVDWLGKKPEWGIMGGKDHFLVAGRITWDFRRRTDEQSDWGNKLLFLPAARNMSMLVIEASPVNFNDFGIPYPTYFHPAKDADMFSWQDRMRKTERKWLFCFAGAPRPGDPKSIRDQIIDQCKKSKVCKLLECDLGGSKCHTPSGIMRMFQSSIFCLQPQGDSYTRRSAFDSILAGCIPVFFHPASAYTQYTWHLPKNFSKYSVLIPEDDVRTNNISIEQWLSKYSREQTMEMREEVIKLIPKITYADPRSKLETVKDAFDVAVEAVIKRVTKLRRDVVEGYKDDDRVEEISWKYALFDQGLSDMGPHEWDRFFKLKNHAPTSSDSSVKAAQNFVED